jgi:hypothetical protein
MTSSIDLRQSADKNRLVEMLKEMPIVQVACKKSGVSRATYYRWRREDREFLRQSNDALAQGIDLINDMSESQLITLIKEKRMPAIAMWLKHNNVRYGAKQQSLHRSSTSDDFTAEEENIVAQALALASGQSHGTHQPTTPQGD